MLKNEGRACGHFPSVKRMSLSGNIERASLLLVVFLSSSGIANCQSTSHDAVPARGEQLACISDPANVHKGDRVTITVKPMRLDRIYTFGSSDGSVLIKDNSATLNTAEITTTERSITVICSAIDKASGVVESTASVTVTMESKQAASAQSIVPSAEVASATIDSADSMANTHYQFSALVAPNLSWTTGTQVQTISGGTLLLSEIRSKSYCDPSMTQFGLGAYASDISTTKSTGATTNIDSNDVKANVMKAIPFLGGGRSYFGASADFFGNNSLGVGLQQTYGANYQFYLRGCKGGTDNSVTESKSRLFASLGVGAGYMNQRLYLTADKLNAAVLPLTAQISYLQGQAPGVPPKFVWYALVGYTPVLTETRAYQLSAIVGLQIPTPYRWVTVNLSDRDLYMNNAPTGFKRNYQNGSISLAFSIPKAPEKIPNPAVPESALGACYGGDKLARLYCYDEVNSDQCAPPNFFRAAQHCASTGVSPQVAPP